MKLSARYTRQSSSKGFTLIELMLASGILVSALSAFLVYFNNTVKGANYSQGISLASAACRSKLEEIISHDFSAVTQDYSAVGTPGNIFNFTTSALVGIIGNGTISITDRGELYGGLNWTQTTGSANWLARDSHTALVYDNKMWVIGGRTSAATFKNDVWWTADLNFADGQTWTQATAAASWSARVNHASLVYDNKMWVIGGYDSASKNDVWYSADGENWVCATSAASWSARVNHAVLVYDNKMWVIGGYDYASGVRKNDVWYSTDGLNWTQATGSANWVARDGHTVLVYDNKMWVIGGRSGVSSFRNDVWYSTNGATWTQVTSTASWSARANHTALVYDNKIWVMGGATATGYKNDVWSSTNGVNWTQATGSANWPIRTEHTSLVYDHKMWVMGGTSALDSTYRNDVWTAAGYNRLLEILITVCWKTPDGRVFGEDTNLNGVLNAGEDTNGNGHLDSPAQLRVLLSDKGMAKTFLGRQ